MSTVWNSFGETTPLSPLSANDKPVLIRLSRDTPGHAGLFEGVLDRIRTFSFRFGGKPETLAQEVWTHFSQKSPTMALWVAMLDGRMIGHTLAFLKESNGEWVVWVTQTEIDRRSERSLVDDALQALNLWAHEINLWAEKAAPHVVVTHIRCETPRITDAWSRHVGFEPYRLILQRKVL